MQHDTDLKIPGGLIEGKKATNDALTFNEHIRKLVIKTINHYFQPITNPKASLEEIQDSLWKIRNTFKKIVRKLTDQ